MVFTPRIASIPCTCLQHGRSLAFPTSSLSFHRHRFALRGLLATCWPTFDRGRSLAGSPPGLAPSSVCPSRADPFPGLLSWPSPLHLCGRHAARASTPSSRGCLRGSPARDFLTFRPHGFAPSRRFAPHGGRELVASHYRPGVHCLLHRSPAHHRSADPACDTPDSARSHPSKVSPQPTAVPRLRGRGLLDVGFLGSPSSARMRVRATGDSTTSHGVGFPQPSSVRASVKLAFKALLRRWVRCRPQTLPSGPDPFLPWAWFLC